MPCLGDARPAGKLQSAVAQDLAAALDAIRSDGVFVQFDDHETVLFEKIGRVGKHFAFAALNINNERREWPAFIFELAQRFGRQAHWTIRSKLGASSDDIDRM